MIWVDAWIGWCLMAHFMTVVQMTCLSIKSLFAKMCVYRFACFTKNL